MRIIRFAFPEAEWRNEFAANQDGSVGPSRTSSSIRKAIGEGSKKRNYSDIRVPILYLPATPPATRGWSQYYHFEPQTGEQRSALQRIYAADRIYLNRYESNTRAAKGGLRIVELRGADHYVFITNESEVLNELRKFLAGLN